MMLTGDVEIDAFVLLSLDDRQRGAFYVAAQDWPYAYRWSVFDRFDNLRAELCGSHSAYSSAG